MDAREQLLRRRISEARRRRDFTRFVSADWRACDDAQFEVDEAKTALRRYRAECASAAVVRFLADHGFDGFVDGFEVVFEIPTHLTGKDGPPEFHRVRTVEAAAERIGYTRHDQG